MMKVMRIATTYDFNFAPSYPYTHTAAILKKWGCTLLLAAELYVCLIAFILVLSRVSWSY